MKLYNEHLTLKIETCIDFCLRVPLRGCEAGQYLVRGCRETGDSHTGRIENGVQDGRGYRYSGYLGDAFCTERTVRVGIFDENNFFPDFIEFLRMLRLA